MGSLIAFFGIPGCGKSTLARLYGERMGCAFFLEPEESDWPAAVKQRDECGYVTAVQWFRSARVPGLFAAHRLTLEGRTAVVDSYFDKLSYYYLGKPGMEWLISPLDSYFENVKGLAFLDRKLLPDADILVYIHVPEADWQKMLAKRNRQLDTNVELSTTYATSHLFQEAAESYASERNGKTRLVHFEPVYDDLPATFHKLQQAIAI